MITGRTNSRSGFSLIEVLVATALLVIIVLVVGMVFRASTISWDSGMQRTDGSMVVRTAIGAIERDLRCAVNALDYYENGIAGKAMLISSGQIRFAALIPRDEADDEVCQVTISLVGKNSITKSIVWKDGTTENATILSGTEKSARYKVNKFEITSSFISPAAPSEKLPNGTSAWPDDKKMPPYVGIKMTLINEEDFSGVTVYSVGRDGVAGTSDDIVVR